ncbi:MAG TPA: cytochrome C oxidase subunit I [Burkholderiales bacterium]|nr:cytochrome C oxidase subunit I [Burkholderiales bacterium]
MILALCSAPTVAAWLAYFVWQPQSRTNYGDLIEPRPLSDREMRRLDGGSFRLSQLRGKWVLLQVDSSTCSDSCRNKLLYMRQARLALGKDAERIERVWLLSDAAVPDPALLRENVGLMVARVPDASLLRELAPSESPAGSIFVIDPLGSLMLRFPGNPDGRKMLKDLARLLRASRIG